MSIFKNYERVLITGGGGFIGGSLIRKLLKESDTKIFNLDKLGYASDLSGINETLSLNTDYKDRYQFFKIDIANEDDVKNIIRIIDPDLIFHLAAESHVDNSIYAPREFIQSNIIGTFNLVEASFDHYLKLNENRKRNFFFQHISTDEVYGTLGKNGFFNENSAYRPNSPYSASKASSDHIVRCWNKTYGLPVKITNCSNNFGPWQHEEKLIPKTILNCLQNKLIPVYGNGQNIRDWLYIDDHIDALITVAEKGRIGSTYCIGGANEKTNLEIVSQICTIVDKILPGNNSRISLIKFVEDRPGHDKRYAIDFSKIKKELLWEPYFSFDKGIEKTVNWYIKKYKYSIF
tara:strand:- start:824 stop:1864 length:1041 start_codon:yes stop_codon:yes gene_type:complete